MLPPALSPRSPAACRLPPADFDMCNACFLNPAVPRHPHQLVVSTCRPFAAPNQPSTRARVNRCPASQALPIRLRPPCQVPSLPLPVPAHSPAVSPTFPPLLRRPPPYPTPPHPPCSATRATSTSGATGSLRSSCRHATSRCTAPCRQAAAAEARLGSSACLSHARTLSTLRARSPLGPDLHIRVAAVAAGLTGPPFRRSSACCTCRWQPRCAGGHGAPRRCAPLPPAGLPLSAGKTRVRAPLAGASARQRVRGPQVPLHLMRPRQGDVPPRDDVPREAGGQLPVLPVGPAPIRLPTRPSAAAGRPATRPA